MIYNQIKSQFIKDKIKGLEWNNKNKEYIDDLVFIENYILGKSGGMGSAYRIHSLKNKKEYELIYKELNPKEFEKEKKRELKEKEQEEKEDKEFEKEELKEKEQARKEWLKMGGK